MKSKARVQLLIEEISNISCLKVSLKKLKLIVKNKEDLTALDNDTLSIKYGLCSNAFLDNLPEDYIGELFQSWSKFTGEYEFPVPSTDDRTPSEAYLRTTSKYDGEYGELRIELAEHLIKKMKKDLKNLKTTSQD